MANEKLKTGLNQFNTSLFVFFFFWFFFLIIIIILYHFSSLSLFFNVSLAPLSFPLARSWTKQNFASLPSTLHD
jgi:hypothetical protein